MAEPTMAGVMLESARRDAPPHADEIDTLYPYAVQARYSTLDAGTLDRQITQVWLHDVLAWASLPPRSTGAC